MHTVLLGPQRFLTTAGTVVHSVAPDGPVATVTAGWQDREAADDELDEVMGGRSRNLHLYGRLSDVLTTDDHFATEALRHRDAMDELAGIYSLRLQRALDSAYAVARRPARDDIAESAFADAVRGVQDIDAWYLRAVDELYGELETAAPPESSEEIARHRQRGRRAARRRDGAGRSPAATSASCCAACACSPSYPRPRCRSSPGLRARWP